MTDKYKKGKLMNTDVFKILPLSEEEIIHIYTEIMPDHFPENELKPLSSIQALLRKKAYVGLGFYRDAAGEAASDLAGYALFLKIPGQNTVLLDYYAILPHYRNLGVGSVFLDKMKNQFSDMDGFLLETEAPETAPDEAQRTLRSRRNEFYYRNGAKMTSISSTLFGVTFHILYLPIARELTDSAIQKELEQTYRFMLPGDSFAKYVTITCAS